VIQLYIIASDIYLGEPVKLVSPWTGLYDLFQGKIHPCVAANEMAVQCFAILELDQHRVALGSIEKS